jgi:glucose-1-phosphate thymidylyltransferase
LQRKSAPCMFRTVRVSQRVEVRGLQVKGILLAGGAGTRLYPITAALNKHLLPVYDKPMIYYPLTVLMMVGVRDILVITTPRDLEQFRATLGDGSQWGVRLSYATQAEPRGIAEAYLLAEEFLDGSASALALGDNVFFGHELPRHLLLSVAENPGATIFAYRVSDAHRYGIVEFDAHGDVISIEEKPAAPKSDWAITGLYLFDGDAPSFAKTLKPSRRNELEIVDLSRLYHERGKLKVSRLGRGHAWLDTGTPEALHEAAAFIKALAVRQGQQICCPEEVALHLGYIDAAQVEAIARNLGNVQYGRYLLEIVKDRRD